MQIKNITFLYLLICSANIFFPILAVQIYVPPGKVNWPYANVCDEQSTQSLIINGWCWM